MPKEHKKRGRREQNKRKREDDDENFSKRPKHDDFEPSHHEHRGEPLPSQDAAFAQDFQQPETQYFGMLDEEEQEYFKNADHQLELNQFNDLEERQLFLGSVWQEAQGKELKIASSQSCSRLLERMVLLSSPEQLKKLFQAFSGSFVSLVLHRFASHCCEALFIHAAPYVTEELKNGAPVSSDPNDIYVSMEDLFLHTITELEGNLGYLMTERFSSHVLRILLYVLSGLSLAQPTASGKSSVHGRKKEKNVVNGMVKPSGNILEERIVPQSFTDAMHRVITESAAELSTSSLRSLATHKTGNPVLQLLLRLELTHFRKERDNEENWIIRKLLPDNPIVEGTESASFVNGSLFDPVASHLIETVVEHAPGKLFKQLYKECFKGRLGNLARNDVAGYVISKVLERLSKQDLEDAMTEQIIPQIPSLVERNRIVIIRTLIERCQIRESDTQPLAAALRSAFSGPNGFELTRLLKVKDTPQYASDSMPVPSSPSSTSFNSPERIHCSLLAQTMLNTRGPLSNLILDSMENMPPTLLYKLSFSPPTSAVLQTALTSKQSTPVQRRKLIQCFQGSIASMSLDPSASHVIDAIWNGTVGLAFIRERIAEELAENEASLRSSKVGRMVWRNWRMDLYRRRRTEWVHMCKHAGNDGFMSFPNEDDQDLHLKRGNRGEITKGERHRSAIDRARESYVSSSGRRNGFGNRHNRQRGPGSGANGVAIQ